MKSDEKSVELVVDALERTLTFYRWLLTDNSLNSVSVQFALYDNLFELSNLLDYISNSNYDKFRRMLNVSHS